MYIFPSTASSTFLELPQIILQHALIFISIETVYLPTCNLSPPPPPKKKSRKAAWKYLPHCNFLHRKTVYYIGGNGEEITISARTGSEVKCLGVTANRWPIKDSAEFIWKKLIKIIDKLDRKVTVVLSDLWCWKIGTISVRSSLKNTVLVVRFQVSPFYKRKTKIQFLLRFFKRRFQKISERIKMDSTCLLSRHPYWPNRPGV